MTLTKAMATKANQASINLTIAIEKIAAKRQTTQMSRGATNLLVASCRDAIIIGHELRVTEAPNKYHLLGGARLSTYFVRPSALSIH